MARPIRLEFEGALYHVTSRGDRRENIYEADSDREAFLTILQSVCERFNWVCHAYCLMSNHYHLLIETPDANLSKGMRQLNGVYTQAYNRHNKCSGHVFQGRYKAILVEKESYLLELARYIVLNPVRAGMVRTVKDWPWSSYRATAGQCSCPSWLEVDSLLSFFYKTRRRAIEAYKKFIAEGKGRESPLQNVKKQIYLGSDFFVDEMLGKIEDEQQLSKEVPRAQRRPAAKSLSVYDGKATSRNDAIINAYQSGGYSMKEVGDYFNLHYSWVSRIIAKAKSKT